MRNTEYGNQTSIKGSVKHVVTDASHSEYNRCDVWRPYLVHTMRSTSVRIGTVSESRSRGENIDYRSESHRTWVITVIRVVSELRKCRRTRKKRQETRDYDDMSDKVEYWLMASALFATNISKNLDRVDECSSSPPYRAIDCPQSAMRDKEERWRSN